jgi:hypothetical protein
VLCKSQKVQIFWDGGCIQQYALIVNADGYSLPGLSNRHLAMLARTSRTEVRRLLQAGMSSRAWTAAAPHGECGARAFMVAWG